MSNYAINRGRFSRGGLTPDLGTGGCVVLEADVPVLWESGFSCLISTGFCGSSTTMGKQEYYSDQIINFH